MLFAQSTMADTLAKLDEKTAIKWIALAGNASELKTLLNGLARNFDVTIQPATLDVISNASHRFNAVTRDRNLSYNYR